MVLEEIADYEAYLAYEGRLRTELVKRKEVWRKLASAGRAFEVKRYCYVCRKRVPFHVDFEYAYEVDGLLTPNWRERLVCPHCQLNNRMRAVVHILNLHCRISPHSPVYITEQTTALFRAIRSRYRCAVGSEFFGDAVPRGGANLAIIRNEDLTRLTFHDNAFGAILSFDMLEHVPSFKRALTECFRCLGPDGTLLFSVPFNLRAQQNVQRARVESDGSITHRLPPTYHGDPMSDQGILCYHDFGWQLLDQL